MSRAKLVFRHLSVRISVIFCASIILIILGGLEHTAERANPALNFLHNIAAHAAPYLEAVGKVLLGASVVAYIVEAAVTRDRISSEEKSDNEYKEKMREIDSKFDSLLQQNSKSVLQSVYQRFIPEASFREIESILLSARLERQNYRIEMILTELKTEHVAGSDVDLTNYFHLCTHSSYRLKNLTDKPYQTHIEFGIEVPNEEKLQNITALNSIKVDSIEQLDEKHITRKEHACEARIPVVIPASSHVDVSMEGVSVKRRIDSEIWSSLLPSDGLTVVIQGPPGLDIQCRPNHSKEFEEKPTAGSLNRKEYELKHGIIPYQSVIAWWNGEKV